MLVLTRLTGESIMIGDDIMVTVMAIEPTRVRLQVSRGARPVGAAGDLLSGAWFGMDERLPLAPDISCLIVRILDNSVRLGVTAPKATAVLRNEVYQVFRNRTDRPQ